jgi:hypothetical protein
MGVTIDADFTGGNNYRQSAPPADDQTTIDRRYLELVSQIVDRDGLRNIKPPAALVNDYLYLNSLVWIGGKPGHGKSFVAIELACCVATGTPWHEHPVQKGRVLYLIAEGASGISDRVDAWERANNQRPPSTELLFLPIPIHMMQPVDVAAMKQILAEITPTLVILTRRHASPLVQTKTRHGTWAHSLKRSKHCAAPPTPAFSLCITSHAAATTCADQPQWKAQPPQFCGPAKTETSSPSPTPNKKTRRRSKTWSSYSNREATPLSWFVKAWLSRGSSPRRPNTSSRSSPSSNLTVSPPQFSSNHAPCKSLSPLPSTGT